MAIITNGPGNSVAPKFKVPSYSTDTATPSTYGISSLTTPDINIEIAVEEKPVEISQSKVASPVIKNTTAAIPTFSSNLEAALYFFSFGFNAIPTVPTAKRTAVSWDEWLKDLSPQKIAKHWSIHPEHELGFIVGDEFIVFDADSAESIAALVTLEKANNVIPNMVSKTTKGEHHFFKRAAGTFAKSDSHSTKEYPDRLDVKTGRALIILPPSTGKSLAVCDANNASELVEVGQDFIDAIFQHNGRPVPRQSEMATSTIAESGSPDNDLDRLKELLGFIDPDTGGYQNWLNGLMAIFHETGGSEDGFQIAVAWSERGGSYKGEKEIRVKWNSFKSGTGNPITIATIVKMAKDNGANVSAIFAASGEQFEVLETEVIMPSAKSNLPVVVEKPSKGASGKSNVVSNPLDQYSLRGMSDELEKNVVNAVPLLGELALMGQATVLFAAPNTGKTMITISLLIDAIKDGRVDPAKVYYLNMDDSGTGLLEKNRIAEEYGFNMIAEGLRDFSASSLLSIVRGMIEDDQVRGVVVILDTLKKFVDLMDKGRTSTFTNVIRPFILKGGTVIALAHTNKHPGKDGKPVYGGVSDILNDIDCAFTIAPISAEDGTKVVEFFNVKRRGNVVQSAAYSYCFGNGIPYGEMLMSVQSVDEADLDTLKLVEEIKSDADIIESVKACINDGVSTKMKLADAAAKRADISRRAALQIIERYTGSDPASHHWTFSKGAHGAMQYVLLATPQPDADQVLPEAIQGNLVAVGEDAF